MNKGYAFGFLLILAVLVLGSYVAVSSFRSSRDAQLAEPTSTPKAEVGQTTRVPQVTAALTAGPSAISSVTSTLTATIPAATETTTPDETPLPAEEPASEPTAEPTGGPTATAAATLPAVTSYKYRLAGPAAAEPAYGGGCCYLIGMVRDAAGNGLEGVRVQAQNPWNPPVVAVTKGGAEVGQYNIPIGRDAILWSLVVVDEAGNVLSMTTSVQFDPKASAYRVDWRRTY